MTELFRRFQALVALYMIVLLGLALSDAVAPNLKWFDLVFSWQAQMVILVVLWFLASVLLRVFGATRDSD